MGISRVWQTTHTICGADGALVIDGPVTRAEQLALASHCAAAQLITTHADWDHLLAPLAFPDATRIADAATIGRLESDHTVVADALAAWDASHAFPARRLPDWRGAQPISAPTTISSPIGRIEVSPTPGHTRDGIALLLIEQEVLVLGDYLSPCEIPSVASDAQLDTYLASLERLEDLLTRSRCVIPGHGWPLGAARARTILSEDRHYVISLNAGRPAPVPRHRADGLQQAQHRGNLTAARAR